ncbi:MAG TPA: carboxypeptidase-like regulatory domain-containing protein [Pyrinomonadaceae bacterium]|nr:carboxypeptidase-like regulatory domain-containing protein [Pyrinomonadaceae bacterium]
MPVINRHFIRLGILLLIASFLSVAAIAQSTGGVKGKVRAMRGDNISGATVTARQGTKDIKSVKSGDKGDFLLSGLESGTYNIIFDARGYSTGLKSGVEVKPNQTVDLGDRLYLQTDQGTQVIVHGSVFYKDGTSVREVEVKVERIGSDGSVKKIGIILTNIRGEFTFRQPEGAAKFRMTVKHKGETASKDIEVDSAAVYRLAISLNTTREK